jgi:hypothetical protein
MNSSGMMFMPIIMKIGQLFHNLFNGTGRDAESLFVPYEIKKVGYTLWLRTTEHKK